MGGYGATEGTLISREVPRERTVRILRLTTVVAPSHVNDHNNNNLKKNNRFYMVFESRIK